MIEGNLLYAETLAEFSDTDVHIQDNDGRTAPHWACAENHTDLVGMCLSVLECDIGLRDLDGLTAFDLSLGDTKMVTPALFYQNLLASSADIPVANAHHDVRPRGGQSYIPGEAIFAPIEESDMPLVNALINRGIDLTARDATGDTALHLAVNATDVEIAIRLLKAGSDVDAVGEGGATPLHCAAHTSQKRMVKALLSWEAKPNTRDDEGNRPLDVARDAEMVRHELDRKANDVESLTPLQRAAEDGDPEIVQLLLELGASVDEKNSNGSGQTALMVAARMGYPHAGELLEAGANIEGTDKTGRSPLDLASTQGFSRLLRDHGAKTTDRNETESTAGLLAGVSDTGSVDPPSAVDDMKDREEQLVGATDVNGEIAPGTGKSEPDTGLLSLLQAAEDGDFAQVQLLLLAKVDMEKKDARGQLYTSRRETDVWR